MSERQYHGMSRTPEYRAFREAWNRCYNPRRDCYPQYGGRGITICAEWLDDFTQFLTDVGYRPALNYTLDRIDNNCGYEPGNVRWATRKQQSRNRRVTLWESHEPAQIRWLNSLGYTGTEIAKFFGVKRNSVYELLSGRVWS